MITMGGYGSPARTIRDDRLLGRRHRPGGAFEKGRLAPASPHHRGALGMEGDVVVTQDLFVYDMIGEGRTRPHRRTSPFDRHRPSPDVGTRAISVRNVDWPRPRSAEVRKADARARRLLVFDLNVVTIAIIALVALQRRRHRSGHAALRQGLRTGRRRQASGAAARILAHETGGDRRRLASTRPSVRSRLPLKGIRESVRRPRTTATPARPWRCA